MRPLERSFARVDVREDWLRPVVGALPRGWYGADRLAADPAELNRLRDAVVRQFGQVDPRTDGVMVMWRYADVARLATLCYARERRVPDLRADAVALDPGSNDDPVGVAYESPRFVCLEDDPEAHHADVLERVTMEGLRRELAARLEAYLAPIIAPLRAMTHLGDKALWGIGASVPLVALAHAVSDAAGPEAGIREVEAVLDHATDLRRSPPAFETIEHRGSRTLVTRDGACCRAYLRPDPVMCTSCPILGGNERIERIVEFLDRSPAA